MFNNHSDLLTGLANEGLPFEKIAEKLSLSDLLQLRLVNKTLYKKATEEIQRRTRVIKVVVENNRTIFITQTGYVYRSGRIDYNLGSYAEQLKTTLAPQLITALEKENIINVTIGFNQLVCVSKIGKVFTCGSGLYGILDERLIKHPIELQAVGVPAGIIQVAAGFMYTLLLTREGQAYACGNNSSGQLGANEKKYHLQAPTSLQRLAGERIAQVITSEAAQSFFVTIDGKVYSCGLGKFGQLGYEAEGDVIMPRLIEALAHERIVQVSAGTYYTLFLTADGRVYVCGSDYPGEREPVTAKTQHIPRLLPRFCAEPIKQISAGRFHAMFLTMSGKVYVCGKDKAAHLGKGHKTKQWRPNFLPTLADIPIKYIAAGPEHSAAVAENGDVYTWGAGSYGQLGHGDTNEQLFPKRIDLFYKYRMIAEQGLSEAYRQTHEPAAGPAGPSDAGPASGAHG